MSTAAPIVAPAPGMAALVPGISAALSFSVSDVLGKIVFASGMDVLSLVTLGAHPGTLVPLGLIAGLVMVAALCGFQGRR